MLSSSRRRTVLASFGSLLGITLLCGCSAAPAGDSLEPTAQGTEALNDGLLTELRSVAHVAVAGDRIFAVWGASTGNGSSIVGQLFNASTLQPLGPSRIYSTSNRPKSGAQVATSGQSFFIVWSEGMAVLDSDIRGALVGLDGTPLSTSDISVNPTSRYESNPAVTWAPGLGKWLVAYNQDSRLPNIITGEMILASYVGTTGVVEAPINVRIPATDTEFPTAPVVTADSNNVQFAWSDRGQIYRTAMTADASHIVRTPVLVDAGSNPSIARNPNSNQIAIGYFFQDASGTTNTKIATFPAGCSTSTCASPPRTTLTQGSNVTVTLWPVVAPLGTGFQSSFEVEGSLASGGVNVVTFVTDSVGNNLTAPRVDGAPACTPTPGYRGAVAASSDPTASYSVTVLGSGCLGSGNPFWYGEKLLPPVGSQPPAATRFALADQYLPTIVQTFDTASHRVYSADGEWSFGDYKAECASIGYISGIAATAIGMRPDLRGHAALCTEAGNGIWAPARTTHNLLGGDDRADTSTGDWDVNFGKAECASNEAVVGISQSSDGHLSMSKILCAPLMDEHAFNCRPLLFSSTSDNRLYTGTGDWAPGYSKNECKNGQIIKGVSTKSTHELHAILCCDAD